MKATIFYSWQSDAPEDDCRYFIRDALKQAVKELGRDDDVVASPRLDHDTQGVAGMPDIAATILDKVSNAAVFVADLTLVAVARKGAKKCPNPNVALELGYAGAEIGWQRLIGVMNVGADYGSPQELIFDLIHKRHPFQYSLDPPVDRKGIQKELAKDLGKGIKACLVESHVQAERLTERLELQTHSFLKYYGEADFFNLGSSEGTLQPQLIRLLDLGILRFDYSIKEKKYAYHWTYLGRLVLEKLGIRPSDA
jgi:hypothetical protein